MGHRSKKCEKKCEKECKCKECKCNEVKKESKIDNKAENGHNTNTIDNHAKNTTNLTVYCNGQPWVDSSSAPNNNIDAESVLELGASAAPSSSTAVGTFKSSKRLTLISSASHPVATGTDYIYMLTANLDFSPNGNLIFNSFSNMRTDTFNIAELYKTADGFGVGDVAPVSVIPQDGPSSSNRSAGAAISPVGNYIAAGWDDGSANKGVLNIYTYNATTGVINSTSVASFNAFPDYNSLVPTGGSLSINAWSHDGQYVIGAYSNNTQIASGVYETIVFIMKFDGSNLSLATTLDIGSLGPQRFKWSGKVNSGVYHLVTIVNNSLSTDPFGAIDDSRVQLYKFVSTGTPALSLVVEQQLPQAGLGSDLYWPFSASVGKFAVTTRETAKLQAGDVPLSVNKFAQGPIEDTAFKHSELRIYDINPSGSGSITLVTHADIGSRGTAVRYTSDGKFLAIAQRSHGGIYLNSIVMVFGIDTNNLTLLETVFAADLPFGLAWNKNTTRLAVGALATEDLNNMQLYSVASNL